METPDSAFSLDHYSYVYRTTLRQSDGRGDGHVANGKIAALADDAREAIHTQIMGDRQLGHALQLVESHFRFLREITYPGDLTIGVAITAIGNSSMRETVGFFRESTCFVISRVVVVKTQDGRSAPFTPEERARAGAFFVEA